MDAGQLKAKGNAAWKAGDLLLADQCYSEGIALSSAVGKLKSQLYSNRAHVRASLGRQEDAVSDCTEALVHDVHNAKAYWRAATACLRLHDCARARAFCQQGLTIMPDHSALASLLACVASSDGLNQILASQASDIATFSSRKDLNSLWRTSRMFREVLDTHADEFEHAFCQAACIYLIGGKDDNDDSGPGIVAVRTFNPASRAWGEIAPLPIGLFGHAACVVGHSVFVLGGWNMGTTFDLVFHLDLLKTRRTWRTLTRRMPSKRSGHVAFSIGANICVAGGNDGRGFGSATACSLDAFNVSFGKWARRGSLRSMAAPRMEATCCTLNSRGYVIGGETFVEAPERKRFVTNSVESFDWKTGTWSVMPPLLTPRTEAVCCTSGSKIMVAGGRTKDHGDFLPTSEVFDAEEGSWTQVASMKKPRAGMGASAQNGRMYIFGGNQRWGNSGFEPTVEVFDVDECLWNSMIRMPVGHGLMACVAAGCHSPHTPCNFEVTSDDTAQRVHHQGQMEWDKCFLRY